MLKHAALAGGALAAPYIVPASVLGRNGAIPPSEKIIVAASASAAGGRTT